MGPYIEFAEKLWGFHGDIHGQSVHGYIIGIELENPNGTSSIFTWLICHSLRTWKRNPGFIIIIIKSNLGAPRGTTLKMVEKQRLPPDASDGLSGWYFDDDPVFHQLIETLFGHFFGQKHWIWVWSSHGFFNIDWMWYHRVPLNLPSGNLLHSYWTWP